MERVKSKSYASLATRIKKDAFEACPCDIVSPQPTRFVSYFFDSNVIVFNPKVDLA